MFCFQLVQYLPSGYPSFDLDRRHSNPFQMVFGFYARGDSKKKGGECTLYFGERLIGVTAELSRFADIY